MDEQSLIFESQSMWLKTGLAESLASHMLKNKIIHHNYLLYHVSIWEGYRTNNSYGILLLKGYIEFFYILQKLPYTARYYCITYQSRLSQLSQLKHHWNSITTNNQLSWLRKTDQWKVDLETGELASSWTGFVLCGVWMIF